MSLFSSNSPLSILIVDDEPKNVQLLGNLLKQNRYEVEFALNGAGAIKWVYRKSFDLILLDIMMPDMDGYEVCKIIKADSDVSHIPIIFLTARTETGDIVKGFEVGGSDYITKPFRTPELLARIKMHAEIKTLRGLIPICAGCKDIRDGKGEWHALEAYIQKHSLAVFSHSMCPKCVEKHYGNQEWYKNK